MECQLISGIQKLVLYETKARYYIVGSNSTQTAFRVLKIDRTEPKELHIQDDKHVYNKIEIMNVLTMIESGNRPAKSKPTAGMAKTVSAYGIVGFVRFLEGYYIILITKRKKVALIGGHMIYKIEDTTMQYIPNDGVRYTHPDEARYVKMFQSVDLSSNFYFSYSYDLTHTLQYNMSPAIGPQFKAQSSDHRPERNSTTSDSTKLRQDKSNPTGVKGGVYGVRTKPARRFVWNSYLLKLFEKKVHHDWILYIIYGFIHQSNICVYGKSLYMALITRRSNEYAGTRFLKRGANSQGAVANELETEQIVYDSSVTCLSKAKLSSFVQMRGSIPVYWSQDVSTMVPKPPISIDQRDPFYHTAGIHFNKCLRRYGAPILLLNLVKRREKRPHESLLCEEYKDCKMFLNQFLPPDRQMLYIGFDMAHYTKNKTINVLERLARISRSCVKKNGFYFHCPNLREDFWEQEEFEGLGGVKTPTGSRQTGLVRTNCVDCLDRTNTAQFAVGKCALAYQLCALGVLPSPDLDFDTDCLKILEELYEDQGDTVALQYGGSYLVHRIEGYRKIAPWKAHSKDILQTLSRYYSNTFSDVEKQQATNVFLGLFVPNEYTPNIWDLPTDFYLHNPEAAGQRTRRRSYTEWCETKVFRCLPLPYEEEYKHEDCETVVKTSEDDEQVDIFHEYYKPFELTSLDSLYGVNIPHSIKNFMPRNSDKYSPFERRIPLEKSRENRFAAFTRSQRIDKYSQELNPNISGKESTSSVLSNTSEEGSTSSASSVEGDIQVTSEDEDQPQYSVRDFVGRFDDDDLNPYDLDLTQFEEDEETQDIYKKYVDLGVACEEPGLVKHGADLTYALNIAPIGEYRSNVYCVEQPTVSKRSLDLYRQYVRCGREGASDPPEPNKEAYRNYVKLLYR